jgi:hypothetical protein
MIVIVDDCKARWGHSDHDAVKSLFTEVVGEQCVYLKSFQAGEYFREERYGRQEKLIVCVHASYQDDIRPSHYRDNDGLEKLAELIRDQRPETRILVYSDMDYPADIFIERIMADKFMSDGVSQFFEKLAEYLREHGDVSVEEMRQRGLTIEDMNGKRVGKQLVIHREREGD